MNLKIRGSGSGGSGPQDPTDAARPEVLTRRAFLRQAASRGALVSAAFAAGFGIDAVWARLVRGPGLDREDYPRFLVGGFRVHHSVLGYLAVALGLVWLPLVLIPLGLGVILGHGRRDRYGFIERVGRA
ncbi:MAG: hypothetical protein ABL963_11550 [Longimicrobiales bacterium]